MMAGAYFDAIPCPDKRRYHFHEFFVGLHDVCREGRSIEQSLTQILGGLRAVMFDEFHVHDVADAVYLSKMLEFVVDRGIVLIATSNYEPHGLLPNPLVHQRFLASIQLIESRMCVTEIGSGPDYREPSTRDTTSDQRDGFSAGTWTVTATRDNPQRDSSSGVPLHIGRLAIRARSFDHGRLAIEFSELCDKPLGTRQYRELATTCVGITLVDVPDLAAGERDALLRFGNLVDVLYDADVTLHVISAGPPCSLSSAAEPPYDAARTVSRLNVLRRRDL